MAMGSGCRYYGVDPECDFLARKRRHSEKCTKLHRAEMRRKRGKLSKTAAIKLKKQALAANALRRWKHLAKRLGEEGDEDDDEPHRPRKRTKKKTKTKKK